MQINEEVKKMTLVRWRPTRDIFRFRDEMDRLFDDFIDRFPARRETGEQMWNPDVDIRETDNEVVVKAEIPGMEQKDINISIKDNVLTLKGEKKQEKEEKEANYHRVERTYGSFTRMFTLPTTVVADKVTAKYNKGVLSITLPKTEEAKPKEIAVEIK
jgi:HSP20 family protein